MTSGNPEAVERKFQATTLLRDLKIEHFSICGANK